MLELYKKNYKKLIIISSLLLIFIFTMSGCSSNEEGLVAKVNNEEITQEEFDKDFQLYKVAYEKQFGEDVMSQVMEDGQTFKETLKDQIIEKLIIEKLLFKEAKDKNITVTDEELQKQLDLSIEEIGGEEKFQVYLEENQLTKELLEENLKKEMLVAKHGENFKNEITIADKEAKKYFEANKEDLVVIRVSRILVETEEEGKAILKRLEEGEEFASLALIESIDSISAAEGGDLGYFTKGILPVEFEDVAFSLKKGEISDLVKTEVGYQIIYLEDRKDTYEDLEEDIKHLLKDQKYSDKIYEIRNNAKVKLLGEFDKKE